MSVAVRILSSIVALFLVAAEPAAKMRVIIETDAGADPDDEQSLVRWLLYTNEWDVEGIICNRPKCRDRENLNPERTGHGVVRRLIDAYGKCHPMLVKHDARYPIPEQLQKLCVKGYDDTDDAVKLLTAAADKPDPRPIWYSDWGTDHGASENNLKRALDRVRKDRTPAEYAAFKSRFRLVTSDQFKEHTTTFDPPFKLMVESSRPEINRQRWYHRFSPITAKAGGFDVKRDVLTGHGPLGELYPLNTTHPQKEGDTLYFLYLIPNGLSDPEQPTWGGWGGRLGKNENYKDRPYYWANLQDEWKGATNRDNVLARWAVDLQNDFRRRLEWCVTEPKDANHAPQAIIGDSNTKEILHRQSKPGEELRFSAKASRDPDGDALSFEWFMYPEPGTYRGKVKLSRSETAEVTLNVPQDAAGKAIHLVLAVRDKRPPALTAYRRIVLSVTSASP
jgi:hypothetical protein